MATLWQKMKIGMSKTAQAIGRTMDTITGKRLDDAFFDDLEESLILADAGVTCSTRIVADLRARTLEKREYDPRAVREMLAELIAGRLEGSPMPQVDGLQAVLVVGVNGVGKTTTIGKLAARFTAQGKRVLVAAGDTFRAAAAEQLGVWAQRAGAQLVRHQEGADPAAVFYDAIQAARARGCDLVLCDTAGRLHNKKNLMDELAKIARVADKEQVPCVRLLVLDAVTGQNAVHQARAFMEAAHVDGLAITKLDGTARGGVVLAIAQELSLPVWFVGVGEGIDDLQPFSARAFARALVGLEEE
nr:signal recognition particle-docking protein FtsY [bacterium]